MGRREGRELTAEGRMKGGKCHGESYPAPSTSERTETGDFEEIEGGIECKELSL